MSFFEHEFEAPIDRHGVGRTRKIWYNVVWLPADLAASLPFDRYPQLRIEGELAEIPVENAFIPAGDGRYYLIVSPEVLKIGGLDVGDPVSFRFRVADQERVDLPADLQRALARDPEGQERWQALTPGRRRALAHHVGSAKGDDTRARRIAAVLSAITSCMRDGAEEKDVRRLDRVLGKR
ncbi:YdeI/OmpD-associated family protein [Qipengyuania qiaonensis]|uniref:YdeI/OmpD-associated family protein n=1 Tax=Qipengyuania qiaonensis TaxID=2867240 RepID=A0ABS7J2Z4_9SPHN|nr:YdeI/OmpD-associated family protein [Qipengyuania qiaonensis]MBX7481702.1 YdeI/OmpD-associated family protein [Qipengyuania qiaonensis]